MRKTESARLMKLSEAQPYLGFSYATVWRMAKRGDLPSITIGDRVFILRKQLMELLEGKRPAA